MFLPRFFATAIQPGELMQIASTLDRVQGILACFVYKGSNLATWRVTIERLTSFEAALAYHGRLRMAPHRVSARHSATDMPPRKAYEKQKKQALVLLASRFAGCFLRK